MALSKDMSARREPGKGRDEYPHRELTERVIGAAIRVHRALGPGFVESIYENALCQQLETDGVPFERQKTLPVSYEGKLVGEHRADLIVGGVLVLEIKAVSDLAEQHAAQLLSTMKAAGAKVGLLMNFHQPRLIDGVRRFVL